MAAGGGEDGDYMGDLSRFLPPEQLPSSSSTLTPEPSKSSRRMKGLSWQEQRKIDRERKQREEDEKTLAGLHVPIPSSNLGFKMLCQMGYTPETGRSSEPVGLEIRRTRAGIGSAALPPPVWKEEEAVARRRWEAGEEKRRKVEEELKEEYGARRKMEWRCRRVVGDYRKAEKALAQLENREVVVESVRDEEEKRAEEEEEEEITEEDLQNILIKLRDEHQYCLYCGCKYESVEALQANCPGPNEDDH